MKIIKHGCSIGVCFKSKCGDLLVFHSHDSYDAAAQRRLAWVGQGLQEFCRDSRRLLTDHQQSRQIECSKISHGSKFFERIRRYYKNARRYVILPSMLRLDVRTWNPWTTWHFRFKSTPPSSNTRIVVSVGLGAFEVTWGRGRSAIPLS